MAVTMQHPILTKAARDIVNGHGSNLNLFSLNGEFQQRGAGDSITATLAALVENYSDGKMTIRNADPALFRHHAMGLNLYLVRCPATTPQGVVTRLAEGMVLVSFGPYSNGFRVGAPRATEEEVAKYRQQVEAIQLRHRQR